MNYPLINTERCQITIATISDAYWLHVLLNDRDVYKNIEGTHSFAKSIEKTTEFICSMLGAYDMERGFLWKVVHEEKSIGFVCTIDFDENPTLCYALNKSFRNNGFMTEALIGILSFQNSILCRLYTLDICEGNLASVRVYKKMASILNCVKCRYSINNLN